MSGYEAHPAGQREGSSAGHLRSCPVPECTYPWLASVNSDPQSEISKSQTETMVRLARQHGVCATLFKLERTRLSGRLFPRRSWVGEWWTSLITIPYSTCFLQIMGGLATGRQPGAFLENPRRKYQYRVYTKCDTALHDYVISIMYNIHIQSFNIQNIYFAKVDSECA